MNKKAKINYFSRGRLPMYAISLVPFSIAAMSAYGFVGNVNLWVWSRDAIKVNVDTIRYRRAPGRYGATAFYYRYTVDGQEFENTTNHIGPFASRGDAGPIVDDVDSGKQVVCYVNPEEHGQSALSRNVNAGQVFAGMAFTAGFVFCGCCLVSACVLRRYAHQFE